MDFSNRVYRSGIL